MFHVIYKHQWNAKLFHYRCERRDVLCNHSIGNRSVFGGAKFTGYFNGVSIPCKSWLVKCFSQVK